MSYFDTVNAMFDVTYAAAQKSLARQYKRCLIEVKRQMAALYDEIVAAGGEVLASHLYQYNRYYDMINNLQENLQKLGQGEASVLEESFTKLYKQNSKFIGRSIGFNPIVDDAAATKALNTIWCTDGKLWSDRIWEHKSALVNMMKDTMIDAVSRGMSRDELVKQIEAEFNVGFNEANRLVRTELAFAQTKAADDTYKAAGIEEFEILAEPSACEDCKEAARHRYAVGTQILPIHPNCRCCTKAILKR